MERCMQVSWCVQAARTPLHPAVSGLVHPAPLQRTAVELRQGPKSASGGGGAERWGIMGKRWPWGLLLLLLLPLHLPLRTVVMILLLLLAKTAQATMLCTTHESPYTAQS